MEDEEEKQLTQEYAAMLASMITYDETSKQLSVKYSVVEEEVGAWLVETLCQKLAFTY